MLGPVGFGQHWHWAAFGKHPVAKDYFKMGSDVPLLKAFSGWVEQGYQLLGAKRRHSLDLHAWRFWAKGPKKDRLVCGVGRDSSDSIGRPYPLLIMGTGPLEGWEDHWDLLPFACEKTWSQIEYLATRRFADFKQLEDEVRTIKPPYACWSEFEYQRGRPEELTACSNHRAPSLGPRDVENKVANLSEKTELFIPLECGPSLDPFALAGLWHSFLKVRAAGIPNAVFMGGVLEKAYLAVFRRPLIPTDFLQLWSSAVMSRAYEK